MSIRDEIAARVGEGRLYRLSPALRGEVVERPMLVSQELHDALNAPLDDPGVYRLHELRQNLDHFVQGGMISIANDPFKKSKSAYLARTHPPDTRQTMKYGIYEALILNLQYECLAASQKQTSLWHLFGSIALI